MNRRRSRRSLPIKPSPNRFRRRKRSLPCKVPTVAALAPYRDPTDEAPTVSSNETPLGWELDVAGRPNICPQAVRWSVHAKTDPHANTNKTDRMAIPLAGLNNTGQEPPDAAGAPPSTCRHDPGDVESQ